MNTMLKSLFLVAFVVAGCDSSTAIGPQPGTFELVSHNGAPVAATTANRIVFTSTVGDPSISTTYTGTLVRYVDGVGLGGSYVQDWETFTVSYSDGTTWAGNVTSVQCGAVNCMRMESTSAPAGVVDLYQQMP